MRLLLVLVVLLAGPVLAACGSSEDDPAPSATPAATEAAAEAPDGCEAVEGFEPKSDGGAQEPGDPLDPQRTWTATITTNCGAFSIRLDARGNPETAASFASLAEQGFYDGTAFHRIVPGFVIQGGDPTASGSGGPGYDVVEEPPQDTLYTLGTVAMAKGGAEAPGTSGSQFFVVVAPDAQLPPEYAVAGEIADGMDVVNRIGELGTPQEQPTFLVVIESVRVESA